VTVPTGAGASIGVRASTGGQVRGGPQVVPRPESARPGGPAPWAGRVTRPPTLDDVRTALTTAPTPVAMPRRADDGRASAVLAALHGGRGPAVDEAHIVLTRRAAHLRHHAGEVSFPGGRQEAGEDLWTTALREAAEEVALDSSIVVPLGELDHLRTVTSESFIVPFVAELPAWPDLRRDPAEVEAVLHVPLADLLHPEAYREERWTFGGQERSLFFFDIVGDTIWGATAAMLRNLLTIVTGTFDESHRQPPWTIPRPDAG